jgi:excisionase family DNA binding protein
MTNNNLMTAYDVAEKLAISQKRASILMRRGDIPTVRIGRSIRVRPEDLDQFIASNLTNQDNASSGNSQISNWRK